MRLENQNTLKGLVCSLPASVHCQNRWQMYIVLLQTQASMSCRVNLNVGSAPKTQKKKVVLSKLRNLALGILNPQVLPCHIQVSGTVMLCLQT